MSRDMSTYFLYINIYVWCSGSVTIQLTGVTLMASLVVLNIITVPTPWKINMEPTNLPFRKENYLPNLHDYVPC